MTCEHREMATAQSGIRVCAGCGKPLPYTAPAAESQPDDLRGFLRARLDEDERVASDAAGLGASRRHWVRDAISCVVDATDNGLIVYGEGAPTSEQADHIARHDPARVLREVEAKRRILDLHAPVADGSQSGWAWFAGSESASERIIRLLALPYADHPDYREEWKP